MKFTDQSVAVNDDDSAHENKEGEMRFQLIQHALLKDLRGLLEVSKSLERRLKSERNMKWLSHSSMYLVSLPLLSAPLYRRVHMLTLTDHTALWGLKSSFQNSFHYFWISLIGVGDPFLDFRKGRREAYTTVFLSAFTFKEWSIFYSGSRIPLLYFTSQDMRNALVIS